MESDLGKLFIGGISWDTTEDHLRDYFKTYGEVVEAVIMKDRNTGRARGFGFIVFADPLVSERVVMDKHTIDGRTVEAKKAVPRDDQSILHKNNASIHGSPGPSRTRKIFVGGLASTVTESDFKKYFEQFGTITDVVVMYDHNTQRPRGFGFITYDTEEAVDKVLLKTFHELNGKMVEVKRAVPKELSPGPTRGSLSGFSYGLNRVNSFLSGYSPGYNPNPYGGYGVRMDGRFSPVAGNRSGFPQYGPPGYGMGVNFESELNPNYGSNTNFNTNLNFEQGMSPYGGHTTNRYGSPYGGHTNGSFLSSTSRNVLGKGGLSYATNSATSSTYMGSTSGSIGAGVFGNSIATWGSSSSISAHGGGGSSENLGNRSGDNSYGLGSGGYGRNNGTGVISTSLYGSGYGGYDWPEEDFYSESLIYGDPTWRSTASDLDGPISFGNGLGNTASDVTSKSSAGYIGGYSVTDRQSNRGIEA